ncbi:MAG: hypothetical protein GWN02_34035, partial [Gemmatimonadetes bacterium]|nr:hypothetical protein [Gemmatimonadota bacterium]
MHMVLFGLALLLGSQGTVHGWVRAEGSLEPVSFASVGVPGGRAVLA